MLRICKDGLDAAGYFADFNHDVIATNRNDIIVEDGRRFVENQTGNTTHHLRSDPSIAVGFLVLFTKEFYTACAQN